MKKSSVLSITLAFGLCVSSAYASGDVTVSRESPDEAANLCIWACNNLNSTDKSIQGTAEWWMNMKTNHNSDLVMCEQYYLGNVSEGYVKYVKDAPKDAGREIFAKSSFNDLCDLTDNNKNCSVLKDMSTDEFEEKSDEVAYYLNHENICNNSWQPTWNWFDNEDDSGAAPDERRQLVR
jgi:hypothetical protein